VSVIYSLLYLFWSSMLITRELLREPYPSSISLILILSMFLIPFFILLDPQAITAFSPEFAAALGQTSYVRVRARLPLWLKLTLLLDLLLIVGLAPSVISS
jgi:hypothetical protein